MNRMTRILGKTFALLLLAPVLVYAQEAPGDDSYDPSVSQDGIIANLLQEHEHPFALYPYENTYLLFTSISHLNREAISAFPWAEGIKNKEAEYQISLAIPICRGLAGDDSVLAISYTQRSWWQVFSSEISSPFRETNYEPQLFLGWATDYAIAGWSLQEIEIGLNHQSNGRSNPTSRGWNRGYVRIMAQRENWQVEFKPWFLIGPTDSTNNPDIGKYLGYYRLKLGYRLGDSTLSLQGHYNWNTGYGGAQLNWSYPVSRNIRFYTQLYSGYGESLIDYNHSQTRFGIGFILNDPL